MNIRIVTSAALLTMLILVLCFWWYKKNDSKLSEVVLSSENGQVVSFVIDKNKVADAGFTVKQIEAGLKQILDTTGMLAAEVATDLLFDENQNASAKCPANFVKEFPFEIKLKIQYADGTVYEGYFGQTKHE